MKFSLLNDINIELYELIGFDLDGTLYEEIVFVQQAYRNIVESFDLDEIVYDWMLQRWKEKGSGYSFIFSEVITQFKISNLKVEDMVNVYRSTIPILQLNQNIVYFIDHIPLKKRFLVTDGNASLQKRKFEALNLHQYFLKTNCGFTGDLGVQFYKPNTKVIQNLSCFNKKQNRILYFGDRSIDEQFAQNAHFDFAYVHHFNEFWGIKK